MGAAGSIIQRKGQGLDKAQETSLLKLYNQQGHDIVLSEQLLTSGIDYSKLSATTSSVGQPQSANSDAPRLRRNGKNTLGSRDGALSAETTKNNVFRPHLVAETPPDYRCLPRAFICLPRAEICHENKVIVEEQPGLAEHLAGRRRAERTRARDSVLIQLYNSHHANIGSSLTSLRHWLHQCSIDNNGWATVATVSTALREIGVAVDDPSILLLASQADEPYFFVEPSKENLRNIASSAVSPRLVHCPSILAFLEEGTLSGSANSLAVFQREGSPVPSRQLKHLSVEEEEGEVEEEKEEQEGEEREEEEKQEMKKQEEQEEDEGEEAEEQKEELLVKEEETQEDDEEEEDKQKGEEEDEGRKEELKKIEKKKEERKQEEEEEEEQETEGKKEDIDEKEEEKIEQIKEKEEEEEEEEQETEGKKEDIDEKEEEKIEQIKEKEEEEEEEEEEEDEDEDEIEEKEVEKEKEVGHTTQTRHHEPNFHLPGADNVKYTSSSPALDLASPDNIENGNPEVTPEPVLDSDRGFIDEDTRARNIERNASDGGLRRTVSGRTRLERGLRDVEAGLRSAEYQGHFFCPQRVNATMEKIRDILQNYPGVDSHYEGLRGGEDETKDERSASFLEEPIPEHPRGNSVNGSDGKRSLDAAVVAGFSAGWDNLSADTLTRAACAAGKRGDVSSLKDLADLVDLRKMNAFGRNALYYACLCGHLGAVHFVVVRVYGGVEGIPEKERWECRKNALSDDIRLFLDTGILTRQLDQPTQPNDHSEGRTQRLVGRDSSFRLEGGVDIRGCRGFDEEESSEGTGTRLRRVSSTETACSIGLLFGEDQNREKEGDY